MKLNFQLVILVLLLTSVNSQSIITDRPDQTESAITVEPGILQIESGIINQVDGDGANRFRNLIIPTNLIRYGISNRVELRMVFELDGKKTTINPSYQFALGNLELGAKIGLNKHDDSKINIGLSDPSGINTYQGIGGHSPRYWFNNEIDSYLIDPENFTYTNSCLGSGYTEITIPEHYNGINTFHFEAFDNYNKRSYKSIELNITSKNPEGTIINNFLALPNPFKNNTYFTFQVSDINVLPINLELKIFDLNGNLIKTIKEENIDQNFKTIAWNGTNNANSPISNGTYLAHIESSSSNGQNQVKKIFVTRMK